MVRERVTILSNTPVRCLHISRLEGRLAYDESVDDDAEGPNVDFVGVA